MSDFVRIFEVGPRDGLQNEKRFVPTADKIELVNRLTQCGFQTIEVTSFVSPRWVPQMADAAEVMAGIERRPDTAYAVLTPNMKGYEAAKAAKADEMAIFASASEGFSQKNINCSIAESIERFTPIAKASHTDRIALRGYISCVTDCPFDGPTAPQAVKEVAEKLIGAGCYEISLGDTIGHGTPETIAAMLDAVLESVPAAKLAGHYHDTKGRALDNIEISLEKGLRVFDSSIGGLGGCPYAPGAEGNVNTLAVAKLMRDKGLATGLDMRALEHVVPFALGLRA